MKTWNVEKTDVLKLTNNGNSTTIIIKELPDEIKFDVETYDRLRADYVQSLYEQHKLKLALEKQFNDILVKITNYQKSPEINQTKEDPL